MQMSADADPSQGFLESQPWWQGAHVSRASNFGLTAECRHDSQESWRDSYGQLKADGGQAPVLDISEPDQWN